MSKRNGLLLLFGITLLAAGLRLWRLGDVPPGLWWDEGHHDWAALNILQGGPWPVYFTEAFGFEPLHVYLTALLFRLLGVHYLATRWVSALAGALTIPALYWAAVEWSSDLLGKPRARRRPVRSIHGGSGFRSPLPPSRSPTSVPTSARSQRHETKRSLIQGETSFLPRRTKDTK